MDKDKVVMKLDLWAKAKDSYDNHYQNIKNEIAYFPLIMGYTLAGVLAGVSIYQMLNIWAWVGIFYPELYAVHKFIL